MDILQDEKLIKMGLGVLESKKVAVIGCGGLGGYVLEIVITSYSIHYTKLYESLIVVTLLFGATAASI